MNRVENDQVEGVDCGPEASQWMSRFLGKEGLRLLYCAPGLKRRRLKDRKDVGSLVRDEDEVRDGQRKYSHREKRESVICWTHTLLCSPLPGCA